MAKNADKGDWIRSQPRDLSFDELSKRAKAAGHGTLSRSYVTKLRSEMQKPNGHSNGREHSDDTAGDTTGQQFLKLVRIIGTQRARKMLDVYENGQ